MFVNVSSSSCCKKLEKIATKKVEGNHHKKKGLKQSLFFVLGVPNITLVGIINKTKFFSTYLGLFL